MLRGRIASAALALLAAFPFVAPAAAASTPSSIRVAFVPMDDRPASEQFPQLTASICGAHLILPPPALLGRFTRPGNADALGSWLSDLDTTGINALVVSADMLAYGGLVASRTADTQLADAQARLQSLIRFHEAHPAIPIYVFGTIMRLAPTETPQSEAYLDALTAYARTAGTPAPSPEQAAELARLRAQIPDAAYWDYIGARARDLDADEALVALAAQGTLAWLSITQDDAGSPNGLQAREQRRLARIIAQLGVQDRVLTNAGADEMGMIAVTRAIEDAVRWHPGVQVVYSSARGAAVTDPLEDGPVGDTITNLQRDLHAFSAGDASGRAPDLTLDVFAPATPAAERAAFFENLEAKLRAGSPVALADLTFIDDDLAEERIAFETLRDAGAATRPLAFASWNTTANSAGTALAAGTCAALAAHFGVDTAQARATFLFDRYADDYAYRLLVRPRLNAALRQDGIDTYALGWHSADAESQMRARLWPLAIDLFDGTFAQEGWTQSQLSMYLPWQRTFEVLLETTLTRR